MGHNEAQSRFASILPVALLATAAIAAYLPSTLSPFFLDDFVHLERSRQLSLSALVESWVLRGDDLRAFWWVPSTAMVSYFRPVITFSFALDQRLWGIAPIGYHFTNLVFHLLATLLVYRIGLQLIHEKRVALPGSLLFLLHPIPGGAVQWISGRTDVIMACFYLFSFSSYLDLRLHRTGTRWMAVPVILGFAMALLSKETALSLPLVLLAVEYLLVRRDQSIQPARGLAVAAAIAMVVMGGLFAWFRLPGLLAAEFPIPYRFPLVAATVPDLLLQGLLYLSSCAFLFPILPFHNLEVWKHHPLLVVVAGALLIFLSLTVVHRTHRRWTLAFLTSWFVLTLLPAGIFMMGQRFAYLPSVGFCLFFATVLVDWNSDPAGNGSAFGLRRLVLPAVLGIYAVTSLGQGILLRSLSDESRRMTAAMVDQTRGQRSSSWIYVYNGWIPSSFWITQASRWLSGGQAPAITVLTLSPDLFPPAFLERHPVCAAVVEWLARPQSPAEAPLLLPVDSTAVCVRSREEGLFESPYLGFFLFGRNGFSSGEIVHTKALKAEIIDGSGREVREIRFTFPEPASSPGSLWLFQENLELRVVEPPS